MIGDGSNGSVQLIEIVCIHRDCDTLTRQCRESKSLFHIPIKGVEVKNEIPFREQKLDWLHFLSRVFADH
jgi:hypothetical protein